MSDSPSRMHFTASPSPSPAPSPPPSDNHEHAQEDRAHSHSLPLPLPSSHLPARVNPTHAQTLPAKLSYPMAANAPQRLVPAPDFPTYYPPPPADHPPLPPHAHADNSRKCPFAAKHEFCPPQEGDVRSPCPALNTMANHGYINRSGKNLTAAALTSALQKCYNLSLPLAIVLSYGGFILLHRYNFLRGIDLREVGKHGFVEHDASLVHRDTVLGDEHDHEHDDQHQNQQQHQHQNHPRSPIKRLTASLSLPSLPALHSLPRPLKKAKKPVYYAPVEIVPQWVDALLEDAHMLLHDGEWAFKVMAADQQLGHQLGREVGVESGVEGGRGVEERKEGKDEEEGGKVEEKEKEGRKLGAVPAPLNLNGRAYAYANTNTDSNTNGAPTTPPSAPIVEPSPSGDAYDVILGSSSFSPHSSSPSSSPSPHTHSHTQTHTHGHAHSRAPTSASGATTASSLSSSAHSALGSAFLPMSAGSVGSVGTAQTTPAQTPQTSRFSTVDAHGLGKTLLVDLAGLPGLGALDGLDARAEVVASPTTMTMTASQTLGGALPPSARAETLLNLPTLPNTLSTLPNTLPNLPNLPTSPRPECSPHRTLLTAASVSLSRIRREAHSLAHAQARAARTGAGGQGGAGGGAQGGAGAGAQGGAQAGAEAQGIDAVHAEIARGEMAIVLGMWEVEDWPAGLVGGENGEFPGEGRVVGEDKEKDTEKRKRDKRGSLFTRFSASSSFSSITHSKSFPSSHPSSSHSSPPPRTTTSSTTSTSPSTTTTPIKGVPAEWFREWIMYERLPGGWRPMRTQGLLDTMRRSREVKRGMERLRREFGERERERKEGEGVKGMEKEEGGERVKGERKEGMEKEEGVERLREEF